MPATARAAARPRVRAEAVPARPAREATPRSRPRPRQAPTPRLAGGVAWIAVVAVLLAGIVALNVAVLRLNMNAERLAARKDKLLAANAALVAEHSRLASTDRVEAIARKQLGLVEPEQTAYVEIAKRRR